MVWYSDDAETTGLALSGNLSHRVLEYFDTSRHVLLGNIQRRNEANRFVDRGGQDEHSALHAFSSHARRQLLWR